DGTPVDLAAWRHSWGRLITQADRLVVFSDDSRAHVQSVWPDAAARLQVIAHRPHHAVPRIPPQQGRGARDKPPVVGVLGNLNRQKGAAVVAEIARLLARDPGATNPKLANLKSGTLKYGNLKLVVLGDTDPACPPGPGVTVHGAYRLEDLPLLTRRYNISAWLIASVWPETFSYTTHEALATGLPVFCLDLGAQAEALRKAAPQGHVITCPPDTAAQAQAVLAALRGVLGPTPTKPAPPDLAPRTRPARTWCKISRQPPTRRPPRRPIPLGVRCWRNG
ncbi:MAG: glycosyltransferase, partial [Paracoccaceae bacterium]|nr:glycosyltransferase [Paracoccaceae bacterium]